MLVSSIQQHGLAISTHIPPPFWASIPPPHPTHPPRSSQSTELSSLCYIVTSHQLSILHMLVYMSVLLCQFILKHSPTTCKAHLSPYLFCRRRRNGAPDGLRSHKDQAQGHSPFTDSKHIAFCILQWLLQNFIGNFPGSPMVKTSLSNAGVWDLIPGRGAKIYTCLVTKKPKHKTEVILK